MCVVDDAQWLDRASAQVLAFVGRRLLAEPVVMLFGAREPSEEFAGLPKLVVEGLSDRDARDLLASVIPGRLDERVADQLVAETRGNPLALLELPRGLSSAQLAGGFGLPGALSLEGRIEESFQQRLEALPEDTQRLLLVAAAEPDRRSGARVACGRAARDRRHGARAGGVGRTDRDRRQGAVSPSAGALGGLPGGGAAAAAAGTPGVGRSDRRAGRSRPARLAPRRGDGRPRRGRRRRARAGGRPGPGAGRSGRRRGLPRARRRADTRARRAARSGRWRRRRPSTKRARSTTPSRFSPPPRRARSTTSSAPACICCALRSCSLPGAAATRPRCC